MRKFTLAFMLIACWVTAASATRQLNPTSKELVATPSRSTESPELGVLSQDQATDLFKSIKESPAVRKAPNGQQTPTQASANAETELLLSENFDLMYDGSVDDIDTSLDISGYIIDFDKGKIDPDTDYHIEAAFTQTPGWSGCCIYQAGGAVALYYPNLGGILNTPNNLNLNGVIRISFRCRSASEYPCTMVVTPCCHDWANIEMATEHQSYIQTFYPEDGWTDVEFEIDVPYEGNDAFVQFNAMTYSDGVIIDDLKIERVKDKIMEPYSISVSHFTNDGFTLSWNGDPQSDGYLINLWETSFDPNSKTETSIDFEDMEWDEDMMVTNFNLPDGWTIELNEKQPQVGTNPLDQSTGILFYEDYTRYFNSRWLPNICTPVGGLVSDFRCQMTVVAENTIAPTYGGDPYSTEWRLYGITDTGSSKLLNKGEVANVLGTTIEFDIANAVDYYGISNDYSDQYYGFELEIWPSNDGCVLVDNIEFASQGLSSDQKVVSDLFTTDTEYAFTGLNMEGEHYYTLQATKGDFITTLYEREHVFGIRPPVALEATEMDADNGSFTANWEAVNGASGYYISVVQHYEAKEYTPDFSILSEDFSKLNDMPYTMDNPYVFEGAYLDDLSNFTHVSGWTVYGGTIAAGMVGCQEEYEDIFYVCTPYLDLTNGNGTAKVYAKAYGKAGDRLRIQYYDEVEDLYFDVNGVADGTVNLSGVDYGSIYFYTVSGAAFFLDEVNVMQDLNEGAIVVTELNQVNFEGGDIESYQFEDLYVISGMEYIYSICSWAYDSDTSSTYVSEPSNEILVQFYTSGLESVETLTESAIRVDGRTIIANTPCDIYDLQGRQLAKQKTTLSVSAPGVYIVKDTTKTQKVIVW
ncbi:MAG: T9SS type A sorting domain-containing protein [Bacteroidales bacterium]|nr:T9SS type A sorting domain-containing protein [Bacteroidales bacterium]